MTGQRDTTWARDLFDQVKPHTASFALHAVLASAAVATVSLAKDEIEDIVEVDLLEMPTDPLPVEDLVEPATPDQPPLVDQTVPLPPLQPEQPEQPPPETPVRKVDEARPFHENAAELNAVRTNEPPVPEAQPTFEVPVETAAFTIDMEATVVGDSSSVDVVAVDGNSNPFGDPRRSGDGDDNAPPTYVPDVELADVWEVTRDPRPLNDRDFRPEYPPAQKARRAEGFVVVKVTIDSEGKPADVAIARSSNPAFNSSALSYCRRLRFAPAEANGEAVATTIEWVVEYRFDNE